MSVVERVARVIHSVFLLVIALESLETEEVWISLIVEVALMVIEMVSDGHVMVGFLGQWVST